MTTIYTGKDAEIGHRNYVDMAEMSPPPLSEGDRIMLKALLEGLLRRIDGTNTASIIRQQLELPGHFSDTQKQRIEEIAATVDWRIWSGRFCQWLSTGRWDGKRK